LQAFFVILLCRSWYRSRLPQHSGNANPLNWTWSRCGSSVVRRLCVRRVVVTRCAGARTVGHLHDGAAGGAAEGRSRYRDAMERSGPTGRN